MSDKVDVPEAVVVGEPDCVCRGTGLVCRLGVDLRPDPESIAVCDCVTRLARKQRDEELRERLKKEGQLRRDRALDCRESDIEGCVVWERSANAIDSAARAIFEEDDHA
jgi:hypothetical protein